MKRVFSLALISIVLTGTITPVFSQRNVRTKTPKGDVGDVSNRFGHVRAYSEGSGVLVEWEMSADANVFGFFVYRTDANGSRMVSPNAILGSNTSTGQNYTFFDPDGNSAALYHVQSIHLDGKTRISEQVTPEFSPDLRSVDGASVQELNRQVLDSKSNGTVTENRLLLPRAVAKEAESNSLLANPATHQWAISQPGVKIGIRNEGFYRITKASLQAAGFNVNGNSALWQLYVEGVEQAIIIGPNADYIEFFGRGTDTVESDTRTYYLVSGPTAGKRIGSKVARPSAVAVTSKNYAQTFVRKERINYINDVLNGDAENYWGQSVTTFGDTTVNFTLSGVDFTAPNSTLELKFQGYSFDSHIVKVTLNGEILANATGSSRSPFSKQYTIPTSFLREGANSIVFRAIGVSTDFNFFDSISIGFGRRHLASQNRLSFYTQNYRMAQLEGFASQNVRVFDMASVDTPVQFSNLNVVQNGATYGVAMPADRGRVMFAVEDSGLLSPVSVKANDPASLSLPSNAANLVIISHDGFLTQAEAWANYRRGQGFTVKVVEVSEIFDEFNYGVLSADSIKAFLNYAQNSWQTAPDYVLLIGDASYDSRNYNGFGYNNLVPTRIVNTVFTETGSDEFLADFNNDGLAEMAVGRIAARDTQSIANNLAKVVAYEQAAATMASRGVLFAYDTYDAANNYDFQAISTRLRNNLPGAVPVTMIGKGDTPPPPDTPLSLLLASMNTGKYVVNYAGHGSIGTWANNFFTSNNVPQLTNANNQSVYTMLTCLNGFFLHANFKSLAENLVDSTNGGAVAAWASAGKTTPFEQEIMATRFFQKLSNSNLERLGDLINDAKVAVPGGLDVRLSWALIGDPMLKVRTAQTGDRPQQ